MDESLAMGYGPWSHTSSTPHTKVPARDGVNSRWVREGSIQGQSCPALSPTGSNCWVSPDQVSKTRDTEFSCCSARPALPWPGSLCSRGNSVVLRPAALLRRSLSAWVCWSRRLVAAVCPGWVPAPLGPCAGGSFTGSCEVECKLSE